MGSPADFIVDCGQWYVLWLRDCRSLSPQGAARAAGGTRAITLASLAGNLQKVSGSNHWRFPVGQGCLDDCTGVILGSPPLPLRVVDMDGPRVDKVWVMALPPDP